MYIASARLSLRTAWGELEKMNENIFKDPSQAILLVSREELIITRYL